MAIRCQVNVVSLKLTAKKERKKILKIQDVNDTEK